MVDAEEEAAGDQGKEVPICPEVMVPDRLEETGREEAQALGAEVFQPGTAETASALSAVFRKSTFRGSRAIGRCVRGAASR